MKCNACGFEYGISYDRYQKSDDYKFEYVKCPICKADMEIVPPGKTLLPKEQSEKVRM